jgi:hypothetical protein
MIIQSSFDLYVNHKLQNITTLIGEKRRWRPATIATIIVILLAAAVLSNWYFFVRQSVRVEAASLERMAYPLPDKPSIAVMPFVNLSGDEEQESLANSISENLISYLSQLPKVFVTARGSMFARWPNGYVGYGSLAVAYSALDRKEEAREAIVEFKKAHPDFAHKSYSELSNWYLNSLPFKNKSDRNRLRELIIKKLD